MHKFKRTMYAVIIVFLMLLINTYSYYFIENKSYSSLVYVVLMLAYSFNYILSCIWLSIYGIKKISFKEYLLNKCIVICLIPIVLLVANVFIFIMCEKIILNYDVYQLVNLIIFSVFEAVKIIILYYIIINDRKYMFKFRDILKVVVYCVAYVNLTYSISSTNADTPKEMFVMMITDSNQRYLASIQRGVYAWALLVWLLLSYQVRLKYEMKKQILNN